MLARRAKAITPSQLLTRVLQFVFHFSSHGSLTEKSRKSKGDFLRLAWATRKFRYISSSMANAIKIRFRVSGIVLSIQSNSSTVYAPVSYNSQRVFVCLMVSPSEGLSDRGQIAENRR